MKNRLFWYLDKEVVETARTMGLNLSRVSENALVGAIERLIGPKPGTRFQNQLGIGGWCGRRDLDPGYRLGKPKS
jgi:hypothetical protein